MLTEINCELFNEQTIKFDIWLNVILWDFKSTNSIGKSTLLLIIDFCFWGKTYFKVNWWAIEKLWNHIINFTFLFSWKKYYFSRFTWDDKIVNICDENYITLNEISLDDFNNFLKENYTPLLKETTFRDIISLYSRIWGKKNYETDKPLSMFSNEKETKAIFRLIKLFNKFSEINKYLLNIKNNEKSKNIIRSADNYNYLNKPTKLEYTKNLKDIEKINLEIGDIKKNLVKYTLNIEELINKEALELKIEKNKLLKSCNIIQNKIERININLENKSYIKPKNLELLSSFFKDINTERIKDIEEFHKNINVILKSELEKSKKVLKMNLEIVLSKINDINVKIDKNLVWIDPDNFILNRIQELTIKKEELETANNFYIKFQDLTTTIASEKEEYIKTQEEIFLFIENKINDTLEKIVIDFYWKNVKAQKLILKDSTYSYENIFNTWTWKSYSNLIIFDICIFQLTDLPVLIHDSFLFKNIEDVTFENIVKGYNSFKKQVFISIDWINKFNESTRLILNSKSVIELSNEKLLFNKDWRGE